MSALRESATRSSRGCGVIIWIDAHLAPALVRWIGETFHIEVHAVRDLGLRHTTDAAIFKAAREAEAVVMSKDEDFRLLVERLGPPPQVLWVTCGNTSNLRKQSRKRNPGLPSRGAPTTTPYHPPSSECQTHFCPRIPRSRHYRTGGRGRRGHRGNSVRAGVS